MKRYPILLPNAVAVVVTYACWLVTDSWAASLIPLAFTLINITQARVKYLTTDRFGALVFVGTLSLSTAVVFAVAALRSSPVNIEGIARAQVFSSVSLQHFAMCAAVSLQIISLSLRLSKTATLQRPSHEFNNSALILTVIAVAFLSTYFSNRYQLIFSQSYGSVGSKEETWGGWPLLFLMANSFLILAYVNSSRATAQVCLAALAICYMYWLAHGNRSEVAVQVLILPLILSARRRRGNAAIPLRAWHVGAAVAAAFTMYAIGFYRTGEALQLSFSTAGASVWSYVVAAYFVEQDGLLLGSTYLQYLGNSIPSFIPVPWDRGQALASAFSDYALLGGFGFIGEAYLNFGYAGCIAIASLYLAIFIYFSRLASKKLLESIFLLMFILYIPRFVFYDFVYFYKLMLLYGSCALIRGILRTSKA